MNRLITETAARTNASALLYNRWMQKNARPDKEGNETGNFLWI